MILFGLLVGKLFGASLLDARGLGLLTSDWALEVSFFVVGCAEKWLLQKDAEVTVAGWFSSC